VSHRLAVVGSVVLRAQKSVRAIRATYSPAMSDHNVLGGELELCRKDPLTGFYRDG
jgi:hypothetical protein